MSSKKTSRDVKDKLGTIVSDDLKKISYIEWD